MTDCSGTSATDPIAAPYQRYFGKYRGKVLDNADPLMLGRILAEVAAVPAMRMNWCVPCVPYAGAGVGFYAMPPVDANVWIEFEGGDVNFPIWSGCFWADNEV
ncbi:MAG: phage baseplate assembly protein V, partial [Xanthobacteraceae bacterium]